MSSYHFEMQYLGDPSYTIRMMLLNPKLSFFRSTELEQVKGQVTSLQTQISQLNTEREELLGKIEAGDGAANTAMQQLKLQNVRMLDVISY